MRLWDRLFGPKYVATVIGEYSQQVHRLDFCSFRRLADALAWCEEMNRLHPDGLTRYEIRRR